MHYGNYRTEDGKAVLATARHQPKFQRRGGGSTARSTSSGGHQPRLQQKMQQLSDLEDCRIKELTEDILYTFVPDALRTMVTAILDSGRSSIDCIPADGLRAVGASALAVATLLNAPPGFLEFLLRLPWKELSAIYGVCGDAGGNRNVAPGFARIDFVSECDLQFDPEEHRRLVNQPLRDGLLDCIMDFLYKEQYRKSLPPLITLDHEDLYAEGNGAAAGSMQRAIRSLLEGSTALHCAALNGSPSQVDQLLSYGANPLAENAVKDVPIELVPYCRNIDAGGQRICRCIGRNHPIHKNKNNKHCIQETSSAGAVDSSMNLSCHCQSDATRIALIRRCVWTFHIGVLGWLRVVAVCIMCFMNFMFAPYTSVRRPSLEIHGATSWEARRQRAMLRAKKMLESLRTAVSEGRKEFERSPTLHLLLRDTNGRRPRTNGSTARCGLSSETTQAGDPVLSAALRAYGQFSNAVAVLKGIRDSMHHHDHSRREDEGDNRNRQARSRVLVPECRYIPETEWREIEIGVEEQARVFAGFAEVAVTLHAACGCEGCAAVVSDALSTATKELFRLADIDGGDISGESRWQKDNDKDDQQEFQRVAPSLATAVHLRALFLMRTDVQRPATRVSIWRAQQCLKEWTRLRQLGAHSQIYNKHSQRSQSPRRGNSVLEIYITDNASADDSFSRDYDDDDEEPLEMQCLESWAATAAADVHLIEALLGAPLPPLQAIGEAIAEATERDPVTGFAKLKRHQSMTKATIDDVQSALQAEALGCLASEHIRDFVAGIACRAAEEIEAAEQLRGLLRQRSGGSASSASAIWQQLTVAVEAAAKFPSLADDVALAVSMQERWAQRSAAQKRLDEAMDVAGGPAPLEIQEWLSGCLDRSEKKSHGEGAMADAVSVSVRVHEGHDAIHCEIQRRLKALEDAVEEARVVSITTARAKKLQKDLLAQDAAADSAVKLGEALALLKDNRHAVGTIKAVLSKAEEAATAAASGSCGSFTSGSDLLEPLLKTARIKLGVSKATETLARALASCRTVADLPKLEAALLGVRKFGAHEIDSAVLSAATDLRQSLESASKTRIALDTALKTLQQRQGRQEDVAEVERLATAATEMHGDLLTSDAARAREAISQWLAASAAEARLDKALREGSGSSALSRVIREASASGVKVNEARRVLKLTQALESALAAAMAGEGGGGGTAAVHALDAKIHAAAAGGVAHSVVSEARRTLHRLLLADVRADLDAVLRVKRSSEQQLPLAPQRLLSLKAAVEKADTVLSRIGDASITTIHTAWGEGGSGDGVHKAKQIFEECRTDPEPESFHVSQPEPGQRSERQEEKISEDSYRTPPKRQTRSAELGLDGFNCNENTEPSTHGADGESRCETILDSYDAKATDLVNLESVLARPDALDAVGDVAAVACMAEIARRQVAREEKEHARLEKEKAEEARVRKEMQVKEKACREAVERERAERARAERAERQAALAAQKAARKERERTQRAERERARQEREEHARGHVLLQQQRRQLAEQARAVQIAQLLAEQSRTLQHGLVAGPSSVRAPRNNDVSLTAWGDALTLSSPSGPSGAGAASIGVSALDPGSSFLWGAAAGGGGGTPPASRLGEDAQPASTTATFLGAGQPGGSLGMFSELAGAPWIPPTNSTAAPMTANNDAAFNAGLLWGGSSSSTAGARTSHAVAEPSSRGVLASENLGGLGLTAIGTPSKLSRPPWGTDLPSSEESSTIGTATETDRDPAKLIAAFKGVLTSQESHQNRDPALCEYYVNSFCEEGDSCRYSNPHGPLGAGPMAAASFAYGAPGSNEFSSNATTSGGSSAFASEARPYSISRFSRNVPSNHQLSPLHVAIGGSLPEQSALAATTAAGFSTPPASGALSGAATPPEFLSSSNLSSLCADAPFGGPAFGQEAEGEGPFGGGVNGGRASDTFSLFGNFNMRPINPKNPKMAAECMEAVVGQQHTN